MLKSNSTQGAYRTRFAPSPSGPLHFGSLVAALGSYLDAKAHNGQWLVRIEDIDTPRVVAGSDKLILDTLERYGLYWDESILYQSQSLPRYEAELELLTKNQLIYACECSRKQIKQMGGIYLANCRNKSLAFEQQALRLKQTNPIYQFEDLFKGTINIDEQFADEDYIVKRRDGLFAYQLVVVLDDIEQQITHIIRGADLLQPTARQISLFEQLNYTAPQFGHLPLAVEKPGFKLSKQNYAKAIDMQNPSATLVATLNFLGLSPPTELKTYSPEQIITWGIEHWQRDLIVKNDEIQLIEKNDSFEFKAL